MQSSPIRRAVRDDRFQIDARRHIVHLGYILRHILAGDAQITSVLLVHLGAGLQALQSPDDAFHIRNRDGIAHPLHIAGGKLGLINADHLALHIQKRPSAVAWIDRRVRLDQPVIDNCAVIILKRHLTIQGADNSRRHRLAITQGVSNGDHLIAHFQGRGISDAGSFDLRHSLRRDLIQRNRDHAHVLRGVCSLDLGLHRAGLIISLIHTEQNRQLCGAGNHMVIGHNQKLRIVLPDDNARSCGNLLLLLRHAVPAPSPEILDFTYAHICDRHKGGHTLIHNAGHRHAGSRIAAHIGLRRHRANLRHHCCTLISRDGHFIPKNLSAQVICPLEGCPCHNAKYQRNADGLCQRLPKALLLSLLRRHLAGIAAASAAVPAALIAVTVSGRSSASRAARTRA